MPSSPHPLDAAARDELAQATAALEAVRNGRWFGPGEPVRTSPTGPLARYIAACRPDVILALLAAVRGAEADGARLDAIERFAITYHGPEANMEDVVQLTGPCHEDEDFCDDDCDDETRQYQWEVTGPPCADGFGNFIGQGPTLRAAVDRALAEEQLAARSHPEEPKDAR